MGDSSSRNRPLMSPEKLPSELVEDILSRVPPLSLARFRTVCKRWNTLFNTKSFIKNHLAHARPQFFLKTDSGLYSVDIINLDDDPSFEVHNLTLETPDGDGDLRFPRVGFSCNGIFLCASFDNEMAVWNPWLRQTRWIEPTKRFPNFFGLGYDRSSPNNGYKILAFHDSLPRRDSMRSAIYEFASNTWRDLEHGLFDWKFHKLATLHSSDGTLYWLAMSIKTSESFIQSFDFSEERYKPFCSLLPCKNDIRGVQALAIFRGDRFSLLEQCGATKEVKIWVTKDRINDSKEEAVSWRCVMVVSIPYFPRLLHGFSQPSYFIDNNDDKRLIVCACDENGLAWVYIVKGNAFKRIQIYTLTDLWPRHLTCLPALVHIPSDEEKNKI